MTAIGLLSVPAVIVLGVIVALWYRFMERRSASEAAAPAVSHALPDLESTPASTST
jgi:predicted outer membrane lipoprotein